MNQSVQSSTLAFGLKGEGPPSSFMYALLKATLNDQNTIQQQQLTDAQTTEIDVENQSLMMNELNTQLGTDANKFNTIEYDATHTWYNSQGKKEKPLSSSEEATQMQTAQAQMNKDSTEANLEIQLQGGATQSAQSATSRDATNLSDLASLLQSSMSIYTALSQYLGQIVS